MTWNAKKGRPIEKASGSFYFGRLAKHTPVEDLKLRDGNEIRVYHANGPRGRQQVTICVEVDTDLLGQFRTRSF